MRQHFTTEEGFDAGLQRAWATGSGPMCDANQGMGMGLYDMSGNVGEWTDTAVMYNNSLYYKVRGGNFNNYSLGLSCNLDFSIDKPNYETTDLGFRCCADNQP